LAQSSKMDASTQTGGTRKNQSAQIEKAPPCVMVIFGAAGDLTKRLVVPALYNLAARGRLGDQFQLVGMDLAQKTARDWRDDLTEMMREFVTKGGGEFEIEHIEEKDWKWLINRMSYLQGDLTDPGTYQRLAAHLKELKKTVGASDNHLFYLAISDRFFATAVSGLAKAKLTRQSAENWRRVIIEKPFGHDFNSARALNAQVLKSLDESQIYRIDHFLGKETVQNIMTFRFANGLFEPLWNRDHIDHIQITAAETIGVEQRGRFYEKTGALRDMVPNHMFQLLSMVAMEPPVSFDADHIRDKKTEAFEAIHIQCRNEALQNSVRGQYGKGVVEGESVAAYRNEANVAPDSTSETYVACKLMLDNWRWAGVPFYIRTGKYMAKRKTEIAICFKKAPHSMFRRTIVEKMAANWLIIRIQPNEGIELEFAAKKPGPTVNLRNVSMDFDYKKFFDMAPNTGYETLIYDCMSGDATLFQRADNVEYAWKAIQPIMEAWAETAPAGFPNYTSGSWGPKAADDLLARDGFAWRNLTHGAHE